MPPYTPPPTSVTLRAPYLSTDDMNAGYHAAGSIIGYKLTGGSGYTAMTASLSGGSCVNYGTETITLTSGVLTGLVDDGTTYGCTSAPTVTLSGAGGTGAAAAAFVRPSGDLWLSPDGDVYQSLSAMALKPIWAKVPGARSLPADVVTGAVACYGNRALNAAWLNGSWIDVAPTAGGSVTTIKFVNGAPDVASLNKVTAGGLGYVSTWYDQCGSALNAVQATAANQPVVHSDILTGNAPSIVFDSSINSSTTQKFMTMPSGVTVTGNADSVFFLGRSYSGRRTASFVELSNASYPQVLANNVAPFSYTAQASYYYANPLTIAGSTLTESIFGFTSSTTSQMGYVGNSITANVATVANTIAAGYIGATYSGGGAQLATGYSEAGAVFVFGRGLSNADNLNLRASIDRLFSIYPQVQDVWIAQGDSRTEGQCSTALQNYTRKTIPLVSNPYRVYDMAYYGQTATQRLAEYSIVDVPLYNPYARNNVIVWAAGINDITLNGTSATALYATTTSYVTAAHATGFKVAVTTLVPTSTYNGMQQGIVTAYNALVRANAAGADAIADVGSDPVISTIAGMSNSLLSCDGTHFTDQGQAMWAPYIAQAIAKMTH